MREQELLEFCSKHCKKNSHNECSYEWLGFGFQIHCNCECHKNSDKKNIVLEGPYKSANTDNRMNPVNDEAIIYDY